MARRRVYRHDIRCPNCGSNPVPLPIEHARTGSPTAARLIAAAPVVNGRWRGYAPQRRDGSSVCVVVEISETANDDDIDLAQERAAILQRATNQTTVAAVIGKEMSATNRQRADRQEVTVVILDDK